MADFKIKFNQPNLYFHFVVFEVFCHFCLSIIIFGCEFKQIFFGSLRKRAKNLGYDKIGQRVTYLGIGNEYD